MTTWATSPPSTPWTDLADSGTTCVRVGVRSPEVAPELLERADLVVDGPPGALDLLQALAAAS